MDSDTKSLAKTTKKIQDSFPMKLHALLDTAEKDGIAHIISWQPHGEAFVLHKSEEFFDAVLRPHFGGIKESSFQRQLNLYDFKRIPKGADKGGYYHKMFLRGQPFLASRIPRQKIKGTKIKATVNPVREPTLHSMEFAAVTACPVANRSLPPRRNEGLNYSAANLSSGREVPQPFYFIFIL
mmetsp:Transcript_27692/g.39611  ORF Transcript_27692/g.39611 Transcript_27692/m.39611 type:complete len:182 (-) Transcript_27692:66-611(-)